MHLAWRRTSWFLCKELLCGVFTKCLRLGDCALSSIFFSCFFLFFCFVSKCSINCWKRDVETSILWLYLFLLQHFFFSFPFFLRTPHPSQICEPMNYVIGILVSVAFLPLTVNLTWALDGSRASSVIPWYHYWGDPRPTEQIKPRRVWERRSRKTRPRSSFPGPWCNY